MKRPLGRPPQKPVRALLEGLQASIADVARTVRGGFANVGTRLDGLEAQVGGLEAQVGGLKAQVGGVDERVAKVESILLDGLERGGFVTRKGMQVLLRDVKKSGITVDEDAILRA